MRSTQAASELFQLIRAMTPSEKRHFRLNNPVRTPVSWSKKKGSENIGPEKKGEDANQFLLLFDVMEHQESPDEEAAMKKLRITDRARFNRIKNYLYKTLLESLEDYYREGQGDAQFFHLINRAQILLSKRLFAQAGRQLAKAEKLAADKGNGTYSLIVLTMQIDRLMRAEDLDAVETLLEGYEPRKAELLERSADYLDLHMIKSKATWLLRRSEEAVGRRSGWVEELGKHPLLKHLKYPEDTEFTLYHYNLNGLINGLLGKPEEDYRNRLAYLHTYQGNKAYVQRWPINYIIALGNVAGTAGQIGNLDELFACTREMRAFLERDGIKNSTSLEPIVKVRSYALELDAYSFLSLDEKKLLIKALENAFQLHHHETAEVWQIIMRFGIARHYFEMRNWSMAIEWLGPVLHQGDDRLYPELQVASRILYVLSHYEMSNDRYLDGYLRQLKQWLRQRKHTWEPVQALLQAIRVLLQTKPRAYPVDLFDRLAGDFDLPGPGFPEPNPSDPSQEEPVRRLRQLLNLKPWLLSKLKPVAQRRY
ncbi:MAG: hypothetical protein GC205_11855 [Bacteroidetes bacterium]|nr:hypothetical protein [Bacteroidota bacterium]